MPELEKVPFRLRPKQRLFVDNKYKWSFYVGGLGAGKTYAGSVRTIKYAVEYPGSFGLVGAPTYPMLRNTTQRTFFELLPPRLVAGYNKNENMLTLINGTQILFASLDQPDRVRGLNLSWFWLDEAPFCGYYAWKVLKARAGRQDPKRFPTAGWATGTPKGKDGFYEDFEHKPQNDHFLIRASTYENSPNLPEDYAEALGYDGAFKLQEIMGQFTAFEGLVYQFDTETSAPDSHIMPPNMAFKLPSGHVLINRTGYSWERVNDVDEAPEGHTIIDVARLILGVDWGFTNPAACVALAIDHKERVWILEEFYKKKASLQHIVIPTIVSMAQRFEAEAVYPDPAEPENILDLRHAMDEADVACSVKVGDNSITAGIQTVRKYMNKRDDGRRGLLVHNDLCKNLIREFGSYQYATDDANLNLSADKRNPTEIPIDQNNHALGAVRYALHTAYGVGRTADIARAAGRNTDTTNYTSIDTAEEKLHKQENDELTVLRGEQASRALRWLDKKGLPVDGLFKANPFDF